MIATLGRGAVQPGERARRTVSKTRWPGCEEAEASFAAVSDEQLAEQIDVAGYIAQAASALERIDDALEHARRATARGAIGPARAR